jgi:hypothetical protein
MQRKTRKGICVWAECPSQHKGHTGHKEHREEGAGQSEIQVVGYDPVQPHCPFLHKAEIGAIMGNDGQWALGRRVAFFYASNCLETTYENSPAIPSQFDLQAKYQAIL